MRGIVTLIIPPLADLVMLGENLEAGKGAQVIALEEAALGGLVCFDSIYEELTRDSVLSGAQVLCVSTNDSGFSDSSALHMHNAQARLRAIESGRYVIRAANTGISSVISSKGEVMGSLGALEEGMIVGEVRVNSHLTLYSRIGNLFVYLLIIFFVWLVVTDYYRRGKHFKIIGVVRSALSR
jgi:apolipoprotein N-acyltransferase